MRKRIRGSLVLGTKGASAPISPDKHKTNHARVGKLWSDLACDLEGLGAPRKANAFLRAMNRFRSVPCGARLRQTHFKVIHNDEIYNCLNNKKREHGVWDSSSLKIFKV
ncbi:hypothetical protein C0966_13430 [Bacillus methanolicus]|nr:hypothetical protein [Bacillus methanolicus]